MNERKNEIRAAVRTKIGIVYAFQLADVLPTEPHDIFDFFTFLTLQSQVK